MADKPTILIVDDAPENLSVLSGLLLPDYVVRVANSGARALQVAASAPIPDLILLDVMMPGLDGYEVIKRLKADPTTRDIPVIFVTALSANEDEYRGLALGAVDYIGKPLKPAIVLARVRTHLELKQARDRLRDENARLEAEVVRRSHQREQILLSVGEGICGTDAHGHIVFINPAAAAMLGDTREALIGRGAHATFHLPRCDAGPETSDACPLCACLCGGHAIHRREDRFRHKDGSLLEVELTCQPILEDGALIGAVTTFRDIGERKRYIAEIEHKSNFDALTGLPNRNLLTDRIAQGVARCRESGALLAVVLINLDRFKAVNDSLGHAAGDNLLQEVARRFAAVTPGDVTLARSEGDEFVVVADSEDAEAVTRLGQELLGALSGPCRLDERQFFLSASLGMALYPRDGADSETLLHNAGAAMTRAKHAGGNLMKFYAVEMNARALERLDLENGLRHAIEHDELVLHYQPQVSLSTGAIIGAEALVRWQHPQRGLLPPVDFIPIAEQSDLILALGEWVLRTACAQNRVWRESGLPPITVGVNLSARQFTSQDIAAMTGRVLRETGLPGDALELELTETILMADTEAFTRATEGLKALSISLSIDDFGTGFSSLAYLRRFSIDRLKIDQSFVRGLVEDASSAAIARAIISLSHSLSLSVIAEGVETREQLAFLYAYDCDEMQGYLFSRPIPAEAFEGLLREGRELALPEPEETEPFRGEATFGRLGLPGRQ
ncbi:EAL domain-containing response regulator [Thiocapsa roseopersicina]|uniref:cyclic-guanylate-specific phosphodiesterase n=1 Tax=Thiocapsa roseopersicina TaxID=1058 RepID=A0A1H3AZA9_THIRO|nr:EAL domain-containing protein [Thiocapsa roseopersicina]SDX34915.1 PAS domain S-box-containing protein/diguanylate cyclase (GGDEF) domain-containing protein [Thiocapsa roseopersicina]